MDKAEIEKIRRSVEKQAKREYRIAAALWIAILGGLTGYALYMIRLMSEL